MKIIFLDIDGVLNNDDTTDKVDGFTGLHPPLIANFNKIIDAHPDAKIVISSTWRKCLPFLKAYTNFEELKKLLADRGLKGEIIDHTPIKMSYISRGGEISMWLDDNAKKLGVDQYVALDDDTHGMERARKPRQQSWQTDEEYAEDLAAFQGDHDLASHHVRTFEIVGLSESKALQAIDVLNGKLIEAPPGYDEDEG